MAKAKLTPFERFERLAKGIAKVPKEELDKKIQEDKAKKPQKRKA